MKRTRKLEFVQTLVGPFVSNTACILVPSSVPLRQDQTKNYTSDFKEDKDIVIESFIYEEVLNYSS